MKTIVLLLGLMSIGVAAKGDSGGPYEAVPDLRPREQPSRFSIPVRTEDLEFYLSHIPRLIWNNRLHEPESLDWVASDGYCASFRALTTLQDRISFEVRYVKRTTIDEGKDWAEALLIVASVESFRTMPVRFRPVYYTCGGAVYDRTAEPIIGPDRYGAVKITMHYSGNGCLTEEVYIRGTRPGAFERFTMLREESRTRRYRQPR